MQPRMEQRPSCAHRKFAGTILLLSLPPILAAAPPPINNRPIIGILTNPNDEPVPDYDSVPGYFAASYVKWLEMAGARVVPIPFERPAAVKELLPFINGVLFTGGDANFTFPNGTLTQLARTGQLIFDEVIASSARGEIWPLWGTCQGFHLIAFLASGLNASTAEYGYDSENISLPLSFTAEAQHSELFGPMPPAVLDILSSQPVTMNAHHYGVSPANFERGLADRFTALSTNVDRQGRPFVSSMEGFKAPHRLPVMATQYREWRAWL